jgi:hypothetical protein
MTRISLTLVLSLLQRLLARASNKHPDYRASLSKDLTIRLDTKNCKSAYFVVKAGRFVAIQGLREAELVLSFNKAGTALRFLLSGDPLSRLIDGMTADEIALEGNIMLLLWFQGRVSQAMPLSRLRNHRTRLPGSTTGPSRHSKIDRAIERSGVTDAIDPSWHQAIAAREQVIMWQVSHGKTAPPF